jgi:hypothetical protein
MPSAKAADLGGDCCADLEERVAELEATTARKGNRKVSLTISGQVNTSVMWWDDGIKRDVYAVDNSLSRSGFNFTGSARINQQMTSGFQIVVGITTGARSHQTSQLDDDGGAAADSNPVIELANWNISHSQLGTLTVGRLNGASAGTTIVDLGGVGVIANANIGLWQRAFFVTQGAANAPNTITWTNLMGGSIVDISALNRSNAVRYDTPTVGGFYASAAWGEDDMWDAALRYAGEFGGFRVAAAVAFSRNACGVNDCNDTAPFISAAPLKQSQLDKIQGSASILHVASGLFLSGAYLHLEYNGLSPGELNTFTGGGLVAGQQRPDTKMFYLVGGISQNWFGIGKTAIYGEYAKVTDGASGLTIGGDSVFNSEVRMWGVGVVQNIDAAAMELFLAYRRYSADFDSLAGAPFGVGGDINDFSAVQAGARISF